MLSYAPQFPTMETGLALVRRLYGAFLTGIAIATGISLCVNPTSCRQIVFRSMTNYITQLRKVMERQRTYFHGLETRNPFRMHADAKELLATVQALRAAHGSLFTNIRPAKKEIAYGRLSPRDLSEIQRLLRRAFLPLVGVSSIIDIFGRLAIMHGWGLEENGSENDSETASEHELIQEYQDIMINLHVPVTILHAAMDQAFDHIMMRLRLQTPLQTLRDALRSMHSAYRKQDAEARAGTCSPGDDHFAQEFERKVDQFYDSRIITLRTWCEKHNIHLAPDSFESDFDWIVEDASLFGSPTQRQLFVLLYVSTLNS